MIEKRNLYIDLLADVIVKKRFGSNVSEDKLQYYRDKAQKIHKNEMILQELEKCQ